MPNFINISGKRFGRLVAAWPEGRRGPSIIWLCVCDCGNISHPSASGLRSKNTTSCGCLHREYVRARFTIHGAKANHTVKTEYRSYGMAKNRCTNPRSKDWPYYGGRGIKFRFLTFQEFYSELGPKPSPKHSVDRFPNKNGNYEPGNVRWATKKQQVQNRRAPHKKVS